MQFKSILLMERIRPKKFLGQHFLKDHNLAKKIVACLSSDPIGETVLEIGPGTGILTEYLVQEDFDEVVLVEVDRESISFLKQHFDYPKIRLVECDFLKFELKEISERPISIIGNLPYFISSQIFFRILEQRWLVKEVVCMIQKEVAERICASHGSKIYGILSVLIGAYYHTEMLFKVPPGVFNPPPKVDSAVIRLKKREHNHLPCDEQLFKKIVKQGFQNRRKTLRNALKPIFLPKELTEHEIFSRRAEQLSISEFVDLTLKIQHWKT